MKLGLELICVRNAYCVITEEGVFKATLKMSYAARKRRVEG